MPATAKKYEKTDAPRFHAVEFGCERLDLCSEHSNQNRKNADEFLPDRQRVLVGEAFLKAFMLLSIKPCSRRKTGTVTTKLNRLLFSNETPGNELAAPQRSLGRDTFENSRLALAGQLFSELAFAGKKSGLPASV